MNESRGANTCTFKSILDATIGCYTFYVVTAVILHIWNSTFWTLTHVLIHHIHDPSSFSCVTILADVTDPFALGAEAKVAVHTPDSLRPWPEKVLKW
jgi:hypothetical protein